MKIKRIVSVLLAVGALAACADAQNRPNQTVGTLLGGGLGALLGSQVGGGKGQLAAVALGALGGAFLGSEVGRRLDEVDRIKASNTQTRALESNRTGVASSWVNPDTGHSGSVKPTRTFQTASGENCRNYEHTVTMDGRSEIVMGTACRQADGNWRSVN